MPRTRYILLYSTLVLSYEIQRCINKTKTFNIWRLASYRYNSVFLHFCLKLYRHIYWTLLWPWNCPVDGRRPQIKCLILGEKLIRNLINKRFVWTVWTLWHHLEVRKDTKRLFDFVCFFLPEFKLTLLLNVTSNKMLISFILNSFIRWHQCQLTQCRHCDKTSDVNGDLVLPHQNSSHCASSRLEESFALPQSSTSVSAKISQRPL